MNLIELSMLLLDEKLAEEYLLRNGILKKIVYCEKCGSTKIGRIRRGKYRCYSCKSDWSIRKKSILILYKITFSKFIGVVKCFSLDLTARETSNEISLQKKGVQRIYSLIREAILSNKPKNFENTFLKNDSPTFSITIVDDKVTIDFNDYTGVSNLFMLKRKRTPNHETVFCFYHSQLNSKNIRRKLNTFPIKQQRFWRFANVKLQQFRGTKLKYLFLYLKEIEFRYNNRENLFDKIVEKLANFEGWS